jgi:hypothetical protein
MSFLSELTRKLLSPEPINTLQQSINMFENVESVPELIQSLEENTLPKYIKTLNKVDLHHMNFRDRIDLLTLLIKTIFINKDKFDPKYLKFLFVQTLKKWCSPQDNDESGLIGDLLSYVGCETKVLQELVKYFPLVTAQELLESQFDISNGLNFNFMFDRIIQIYGKRSIEPDVLRALLQKAKDEKREELVKLIEVKFNRVSMAPPPNWVDVRPGETLEMLRQESWNTQFESKKIDPQIVMKEIMDNFDIVDEEKEEIDPQTLEDAVTAAAGFGEQIPEGTYKYDPDRVFGPINRHHEECISGLIPGGCRMLTCRCKDYDQGEDSDEIESLRNPYAWFTEMKKECNTCDKKIRDLSHAIRYPVFGGGWVGCYCSLECLETNKPRESNCINDAILNVAIETIELKGIVDRSTLTQ